MAHFLKVVIAVPLLMRRQQVFPGVGFFEAPVSHPPLDVYYVEYIYPHDLLCPFRLVYLMQIVRAISCPLS